MPITRGGRNLRVSTTQPISSILKRFLTMAVTRKVG
jgi:hypothetical protein